MKFLLIAALTLVFNLASAQINCDSIPSDFTGVCSTHYSDGTLKSTTDYLNGVKQGEYKAYYHHGELGAQGEYVKGNFVGKFERFSPKGLILLTAEIDENGNGEMSRFNYNGTALMTYGKFENWRKTGVWTKYNYKGDILEENSFDSSNSDDASFVLIEEFGFGEEPSGVVDFPSFETYYVGGTQEMQRFIRDNVQYPSKARKKNISGKVYVGFVVNEDGSISDVRIVRGIHPTIDGEAIRLVKSMPNWDPAVEGGMRVKARVRLPITFSIER